MGAELHGQLHRGYPADQAHDVKSRGRKGIGEHQQADRIRLTAVGMAEPAAELAATTGFGAPKHLATLGQPDLHAGGKLDLAVATTAIFPGCDIGTLEIAPTRPLQCLEVGIGRRNQQFQFLPLVEPQVAKAGTSARTQQLHPAIHGAERGRGEVKSIYRERIGVGHGLAQHPAGQCQGIAPVGHFANPPAAMELAAPVAFTNPVNFGFPYKL